MMPQAVHKLLNSIHILKVDKLQLRNFIRDKVYQVIHDSAAYEIKSVCNILGPSQGTVTKDFNTRCFTGSTRPVGLGLLYGV